MAAPTAGVHAVRTRSRSGDRIILMLPRFAWNEAVDDPTGSESSRRAIEAMFGADEQTSRCSVTQKFPALCRYPSEVTEEGRVHRRTQ